jgi:hypothetical protein
MTEAMTAKTYDADYFASQLDAGAAALSGGQKTDYLKLTGGQNEIRLLPSDPLFVVLKQHGYKNSEGRFTSALDYGFILSNVDIQEAAVAKGTINGDDLAAAREFGDPFTALAVTGQKLGVEDKQISQLWPRTRVLWNAIDVTQNDNTVRLFESSKQFFNHVLALAKRAPDMFMAEAGRNLGIAGNGRDGIQRRYEAPIADFEVSAVEFDPDDLIDLQAVVVRKVRPWAEKAVAMFSKHGDLAAQLGITPDMWGL